MARRKVQGIKLVQQQLQLIVDEVNKEAVDIVQEAAQIAKKHVDAEVPVDTGALRASGKINVTTRNYRGKKAVAGVLTYGGRTPVRQRNSPMGLVNYATYVHELQKPFLIIGVNRARSEINSKVKERFRNVLRRRTK